jgi:hypothetical protein
LFSSSSSILPQQHTLTTTTKLKTRARTP